MTDQDFSRLVGKYRASVYRLALCYMKDHADAEDVTQDAFFKLFTCARTFPADEEAKAWLLRTAANRCKDLLKSHWYRFSEPLDEDMPAPDSIPDDSGLLAALMKLPPKTRAVMYMHYYEEYSVKEIAELIRISETAVTSQLWRGRKRLKELLHLEDKDNDKESELCDGVQ